MSRAGAIANIVNTLSKLALGSAALLVVSGTLSALARLGSIDALWTTTYGEVLCLKLARRSAWSEVVVAVGVVGVSAVLVSLH